MVSKSSFIGEISMCCEKEKKSLNTVGEKTNNKRKDALALSVVFLINL